MGLQAVSILTEGVWASLTGGWYYDKKQSHFSNLFHLYIWLIFLCFPFVNYIFLNTWISWMLYCLFIALAFIVIKSINEYFHRVFDTGKCIKDETASSFQDPVTNYLINNGDAESVSGEKETLEMVTISNNSQINNDRPSKKEENINSNKIVNDMDSIKKRIEATDDNCSNEITSKTIDLKADVHHNESDSSFGNLSLLFKSEDEPYVDSNEQKELPRKISNEAIKVTPVVTSDTSLSNITAIYNKGNSSNNSIGILENINKCEQQQMHTFRRARSEIETIKRSEHSRTLAMPPSHPVSLEIINSKTDSVDKSVPLDKSKFNTKDANQEMVRSSKYHQKSLKSFQSEETGITNKMSRIEENQNEKQLSTTCSSAYIKKDCDSSEDGDESEISLCTNDSVKAIKTTVLTTISAKKMSKQPMRKTRFSSNSSRKRSKSSTTSGRSDWTHKSIYHELDRRNRIKPSMVLLNTSDEDDNETKTAAGTVRPLSNRFQLYHRHSDSSSFPSSSSSSPLSMISGDGIKHENFDPSNVVYPINYPSTSSGISHRIVERKRFRNKYPSSSSKAQKYQTTCDCVADEDLSSLNLQNKSKNLRGSTTSKTYSRSNSIRDGESSKNSIVCSSNSPNIINEILTTPGTHFATSHEDTTVGAVHVFQDEHGNWFTYTFDENSTGLAKGLCPPNPFTKLSSTATSTTTQTHTAMPMMDNPNEKFKSSNALIPSTSIFYLNNPLLDLSVNSNNNNNNNIDSITTIRDINKLDNLFLFNNNHSSQTPDSIQTNQRQMYFDPISMFDPNSDASRGFALSIASDFISSLNNQSFSHSFQRSQQQLKPAYYYEVNLLKIKTVKIRFDRLALLAFLDRNITTCELICSILLSIAVAVFTAILLNKEFFHDIRLFVFCFVVAGSHYTLLKSVQPDAASPTHGFNRIAIYSRPIYFCLVSAIILLSNDCYNNYSPRMENIHFEMYGFNLINRDLFLTISNIAQTFILIFPLLFMFGLLPQCNTFVMYIFEHIDIHLFGGTASTMGMISAIYSISRSILAIAFLYLCAHLLNLRETQRTTFSVFCGILAAMSYLLSRSSSDPSLLWNVIYEFLMTIKNFFVSLITNSKSKSNSTNLNRGDTDKHIATSMMMKKSNDVLIDPLPEKLKKVACSRFESDFITCIFVTISVFSVHVSSIFKLQPYFNDYITGLAVYWSFIVHYLIPQFRKQLPWLLFSSPICKSAEYKKFEVQEPAKNMWFEKLQAWLWLIEKNILYPLLFLSYITTDCPLLIKNYGNNVGMLLLVIFGFKCLRSSFNDPSNNYIIVIFTHLFFYYDFRIFINNHDNIFLMNFFIMSFIYYKITDFLLKFRFVITYVAPWQITWGSAFHAFAQPFSVPHSALLMVQIFVSSLLSAPLQPILGSAIFFTSYVRPIKFWERDYNTKRVDHSNTRLASQIDKAQIGSDDNNLNSIFYEHLTRSLQHSLYGDLILGRWGDVSQGDCFVLAIRGLEFRGTYCQQREVEAITENVSDFDGCCCCESICVNGVLSINAAFNQRWLSWEVTHTNYVLEGYSISEHIASTILQPYDLRKALITYYVKSIIYFVVTNENFVKWIENEDIKQSLSYLNEKDFVDLDPTFNYNIDEDYDVMESGITRSSFHATYFDWINYCIINGVHPSQSESVRNNEESALSLCMGLSLLGRRALGTASHHNSALMNVEFFLYGFHALFKGDFRIHCSRDEWVFQDIDFLDKVVSPSIRMSLKLHQDQFYEEYIYEHPKTLFDAITQYHKSIVISHEADPIWRKAILSNVPSLLALRHVFDEGTDQYKVIMLNKRFLNFRIIKINRECVRGLWAGQQQELIFLRNRNPERGSIQNAKQVLRNIINSSCDQPIGYPIYVSPLTTSFSETSTPLNQIIGPSLSFSMFKRAIVGFFNKIRNRCNEVCTGSSGNVPEMNFASVRLTKSESSDRGIEDSKDAKGSLIVSSQSQIVQISNYSQYLKKRNINRNDEEAMHNTSSNLVTPKNVLCLLQNSINQTPSTTTSSVNQNEPSVAVTSMSNKPITTVGQISDSSINVTNVDVSKSLIIEKGFVHPKGDAV
ncbi:hypothetical protein DERF_008817 [Dermatophagoides farinae]|uniref:Pecanex-like protein n=1 Tax=Dermatophagoides farinae TaxID=6954 RepID=A0A922I160_DERFA|nr:hypothetical protein DERF_008817 [Dermatophagoides farinae]